MASQSCDSRCKAAAVRAQGPSPPPRAPNRPSVCAPAGLELLPDVAPPPQLGGSVVGQAIAHEVAYEQQLDGASLAFRFL